MAVTDLKSVSDLKSYKSKDLVVLHFWANWAPQCEQIKSVFNELAKEPANVNVSFINVEAESFAALSKEYGINAVPTCIFIKNETLLEQLKGANPSELSRLVQKHSQAAVISKTSETTRQPLETRLKALINSSPVMLFMKGNRDEPRCGFSRQIVALLGQHNASYKTFDILGDEEVRQGLKTFSNWPTYPQLYINGDLVGGLDIIKEMEESGDLGSMLPKEQKLEDKLKSLIGKESVMLFMKGSPDEPRCGFSRQITAILKEENIKFGHFDILQDEEVRQGLKTFSNWPTFPQIYVKGELIGGLDIIKELKENGELAESLKG